MIAAGEWVAISEAHPAPHQQVLVRLREGAGDVCDVACFVGRQPDGELRWIMADIRLESRQLTHWALIFPPEIAA